MAELAKKLHFLKNGTEQTAKIYTTASEAGSNYIKVKVSGSSGYVALGETTDELATKGRVSKAGTIYAILSEYYKGLRQYGTATALSVGRGGLAATTVGNYALFGGGSGDKGYSSTVDAYTI